MFREEIDIHLKLYDLNACDGASLPPYLQQLTGKHVSKSIKYKIITSKVRNTEYYDGRCVPLPATPLMTIKKRKYISEDPYLAYCTA